MQIAYRASAARLRQRSETQCNALDARAKLGTALIFGRMLIVCTHCKVALYHLSVACRRKSIVAKCRAASFASSARLPTSGSWRTEKACRFGGASALLAPWSASFMLGSQQAIGEFHKPGARFLARDVNRRCRDPIEERAHIGNSDRVREEREHRRVVWRIADE